MIKFILIYIMYIDEVCDIIFISRSFNYINVNIGI